MRRALCFLLFLVSAWPAHAAPNVVASIKPVHSLVAGVMAGVAEPQLLIGGSASPHSYSLKPSDAQRLSGATVVFWIGPILETFLEKPLQTLAGKARLVSLIGAEGVDAVIVTGIDYDCEGCGTNPHVWLDPINAKAMVAAIADTLVAVDVANAARYRANADAVTKKLKALDDELQRTLAPVKSKPFIAFHDAYASFEMRYGLKNVGTVTINPERPPGAHRVAKIKNAIEEFKVVCVFAEPQFEPALMGMLVKGTAARSGTLDPEGTALTPGVDLYFTLMRDLAHNLSSCLAQ